MDDLISRSALLQAIKRQFRCAECNNYDGIRCRACPGDDMMSLVDDMPSIDALKLPCNIGCEVYSIEPIWYYQELHKGVHRGKVVGIEVNAKKHKMVWIHLDLMSEGSACAMDFEDFGKKIFFSKDEAWSALNQEDAHAAD